MGAEVPAPATDRISILIVEDEAILRISTADFLRTCGYHVVEAANVTEAISVLTTGRTIHLVLSDVNLPGMVGGLSLAAWLRNFNAAIPIILTSGVEAIMPALKAQNAVPFLAKPYDDRQLSELIARVINKA